ncbi:hypothetical protein MMC09_004079 [Bachmanniomyces sp. S44760]|nr:hypothetical protein [Bachmanniomyces sp. S44760]
METTLQRVPIPKNGVDFRGKVVLAPMVRSGELPSRLLALKYGADLVWGPETVDKSMIGTTKKFNPATSTIDFTRLPSNGSRVPVPDQKESLIYRLHPTQERGRLIFQIGTSSPILAVEVAKLVAPDVAGIDVNAGCPKPFSTSGGMGAALLRTPDLLVSILEALVKEVGLVYEIGISVKIRLLETPKETEALVKRLCKTGITGLTVHCRTTPMRPRERAIREQLRMIGDICREEGVACLMNGDVVDRDQAIQLAKEYNVDGGMIATAAEANSSCFRTREQGGLLPWKEVVSEYVKLAIQVENRYGNTKFLLSQLMPGKREEYQKVVQAKSYRQICEILELESLYDQASDVDDRLGLTGNVLNADQKSSKKKKNKNPQSSATNMSNKKRKIHVEQPQSLPEGGMSMGLATAVAI